MPLPRTERHPVIASGNLATARRTVAGVLSQFSLFDIPLPNGRALITGAGLSEQALEQPDFPISMEQELTIALGIVRFLAPRQSPISALFTLWQVLSLDDLGVIGMAMRHAATAAEALNTILTYPQLSWGHSRMMVQRSEEFSVFSFAMERPTLRNASPQDIDQLISYCIVIDLLSSLRNVQDLLGVDTPPVALNLAFPKPDDWTLLPAQLPCKVSFNSESSEFVLPAAFDDTPLPKANPVMHKSYVAIVEKLSQLLSDNISVSERVTRWLWTASPPPGRREVAKLLNMSERNLSRQLAQEQTTFAQLLADVQVQRATAFLRNPALTIGEVGYRLGYSEPAAFTRAFSKWTGKSPSAWRQNENR
ncbi:MAG: helix-turn-helix domain-containing protein [Halioglobus sp.]